MELSQRLAIESILRLAKYIYQSHSNHSNKRDESLLSGWEDQTDSDQTW